MTEGPVYANNKGSFAGRFTNGFQCIPPTLFAGLDLKGYTGAEPSDVQELFQSGLTMLLNEEGKAQVVERREIDGREWLNVITAAGELFSIVSRVILFGKL